MKNTSQNITLALNDEELWNRLNNLVSKEPNLNYNDTSLLESFEKIKTIREIINHFANNGKLDMISATKRNELASNLSTLKRHSSGNPTQVIIIVDTIQDIVTSAGMYNDFQTSFNPKYELDDLLKLKNELNTIIKRFQNHLPLLEEIKNLESEAKNIKQNLLDLLEKAKQDENRIENLAIETINHRNESETSLEVVKKNESETETKKLSISTFAENIDEYKQSIENLESKAKSITDKEETINNLIKSAEQALNLKSAEGISAAFSQQYNITLNQNSGWWIFGAVFFIIFSLLLTGWIVSGYQISNPNSWSSIIGRIVAVGITITAAGFCANQYTRNKNLSEDYAYKAVLSKSIIAFTEEIKKRDDAKVAEYLTKVLDEIHKDPMRSKSAKEEKTVKIEPQTLLEKLIDKFPG